ncbi:uncharacterized protein LOC108471317 [Gossypium arboreum]|uniref:uncharacterized protein LOC108471317 n=1 Tax=Gossypium arboreum TaxID=29729 RepID=UPI000819260C|nr:uncharacterized protein LOC108471317 [Gossypium arboreum]
MDYSLQKLTSEIVRLHGVSISIISDKDPRFTYQFCKKLHETLGLRLDFSIAFYPQTNGQSEKVKTELGEEWILGPKLVSKTKYKVRLIQDRLKTASDMQKYYADLKRRDIEYTVGDFVFLKLKLPLELDHIHDMFHVLMLMRYWSNPSHIVSVEEIEIKLDLTFEEDSVYNLDRDIKVLRRKSILLVKVLWRNHSTEEATWEPHDSMHQ